MPEIRIPSSYKPTERQWAFHSSRAKAKGYGGSMGGGKSRALCEETYRMAMGYPGIEIVMARQEHTSIAITTRKTMFREVLPTELVKRCRIVKSGGYDFIEFPNGSVVHFVGLNDPVKFHSAEIGLLVLDEAHQIDEDAVMTMNTRLRQKCVDCLQTKALDCNHLPRQILCGFNPENPGHWLYRWFIAGADETEHGFYKPELRLDEDSDPIGDAEFVKALPTDNPYLPEGYIKRELAGLKPFHRRRYLGGEWLFVSGNCFFDEERLSEYANETPKPLYRFSFKPVGRGDRAKKARSETGWIRVYREPVEGHSYAIGADVATGRGMDFSTAYVVDLSDMSFCAEFHGKLDADQFAEQLHFLGRWFLDAFMAVETGGGYGEAVIIPLRDGKGPRPPYPRLYRHILSSRPDIPMAKPYGYPMNVKTRSLILNQLEKAVREKSLPWMTTLLVNECHTFCEFEEGTPSPRAQPGCNDDTVFAAAIALEMYRLRGQHPDRHSPRERFAKPRRSYPWQRRSRDPLADIEARYPKGT